MDKIRTSVPSLPEGWIKEVVIRKSGASAGKSDVYYYSPDGKKCRSKPQMLQYLPEDFDIDSFDFRGGASEALLRRRKKRKDDFNFGKDFALASSSSSEKPSRQTKKAREYIKICVLHSADIEGRKNETTRRKNFSRAEQESKRRRAENLSQRFSKPKQLFWQSRLQNLTARNGKTSKSCKASKIESAMKNLLPSSNEQSLLNSLWYSLFTSNKVSGQQHASLNALRKHPTALCSIDQPFTAPFTITEEMIRNQEKKVLATRKKLCEAQELLDALQEEELDYEDLDE